MVASINILDVQNPYPRYKDLRSKAPISFDPVSGYWIVTKYEAVKQIMRDEENFSARLDRVNYSNLSVEAQAKLCPINFQKLYGLSTTENPSHDQVLKVLMPAFNRLVKYKVKDRIEQIVQHYLDGVKNEEEFDIISRVFNPLPAELIFILLGIERSEIAKVKHWSESRLKLTWGTKEDQVRHASNIVNYWNFCKNLIAKKMDAPADDLPSILLESYYEGKITLREIQLLCYGLIFSGHTTTSAFLGEALHLLLKSGVWDLHRNTGLCFSKSVEEMLRLCPSAITRRRIAKNAKMVGGHQFEKGDEILLMIGSANRDEAVFPNPDQIILDRPNARKHLTLGSGFHYCIGSKLVKLEYETIMAAILKNFPYIHLSSRNKYKYPKNISIRALETLYVNV